MAFTTIVRRHLGIDAISRVSDGLGVLPVSSVRDPLPEQYAEDVGLEVGWIDGATQGVGVVLQATHQLVQADRHCSP